MPEQKLYGWKVVFSNDRMGFRRSYAVQAPTMSWAIDEAFKKLEELYSERVDEFYAIEALRGREIGT